MSKSHERQAPVVRLCGEEVPQPGHICAFFDSRQEKYATLAPFFADAITAGDSVINVVPEASLEGHMKALRAASVPVDEALADSRLRVDIAERVYARDGQLALDGVLDMLRAALATAEAEARCLRTCGEMDWIAEYPTALHEVMEYEARVNSMLTSECTMMCVYDMSLVPASVVSDILATHSHAIINGRLRPNPYAVPPDEYMAMMRGRRAAT